MSATGAGAAATATSARLAQLWHSPVGPKTVFFWGPVAKTGLVVAGLKDLERPPERLSVSQNLALAATGFIWTRWCLIIKPINYPLSAVNFFVGCTGLVQLYRVWDFRRQNPDWDKAVL